MLPARTRRTAVAARGKGLGWGVGAREAGRDARLSSPDLILSAHLRAQVFSAFAFHTGPFSSRAHSSGSVPHHPLRCEQDPARLCTGPLNVRDSVVRQLRACCSVRKRWLQRRAHDRRGANTRASDLEGHRRVSDHWCPPRGTCTWSNCLFRCVHFKKGLAAVHKRTSCGSSTPGC